MYDALTSGIAGAYVPVALYVLAMAQDYKVTPPAVRLIGKSPEYVST